MLKKFDRHGMNLKEFAQVLRDDASLKEDMIVDRRALALTDDAKLKVSGAGEYDVRPHCHRHIGELTGIPAAYYDKCLGANSALLARNVNHWMPQVEDDKTAGRMLRTIGGDARALLSSSYRRIDHEDVAEHALPVLLDIPGLRVLDCAITETKMYLKVMDENMFEDVAIPGGGRDIVRAGLVISNSEVGNGSVLVQPLLRRDLCGNNLLAYFGKMSARHSGARHDLADVHYEMLSDETRALDAAATLAKLKDVIKGVLSAEGFGRNIAAVREAQKEKIGGDPIKAIERLSRTLKTTEQEKGSILRHLIEGGDLSRWGVLNAVTSTAQDLEQYERQTHFEALGGKLLDMPAGTWREIAEAA